ncbi:MAG: hypothetical protein WCR67_00575 [Bacilli bacterium]
MTGTLMYHGFLLPDFYLTLINENSIFIGDYHSPEKEFGGIGYDYVHCDLDELVIKAKVDKNCLNEVFSRFDFLVNRYSTSFVHDFHAGDVGNVETTLYDTIGHAVILYDPLRGHFENLVRKMFKLSLMNYRKNIARQYRTSTKYFGERVYDNNDSIITLADSIPDDSNQIREIEQSLDLSSYTKCLEKSDKEILFLYLDSYTYDEIAKVSGLSRSSVSLKIIRMIEELLEWKKRKLI